MDVFGKLEDQAGTKTSWRGYRVTLEFAQKVKLADADPISVPTEITAEVADDGTWTTALPDRRDLVDPIVLKPLAPAGAVLLERPSTIAELAATTAAAPIVITVVPVDVLEISPRTDVFLTGSPKLTGRIMDFNGERLIANRQVLVFGEPKGSAGARMPVLVTRTDSQGYFSADYPRILDAAGRPTDPIVFDRAWATVSDARDIDGSTDIPIRLVRMGGFDGVLPRNVLLVVLVGEDAAVQPDDCACHSPVPRSPDNDDLTQSSAAYTTDLVGGKCVELNSPNRALEEYSFYSVVRTTDPELFGNRFVPGPRIPITQVIRAVANIEAIRPEGRIVTARPPRGREARVGLAPSIVARYLSQPGARAEDVVEAAATATIVADTVRQMRTFAFPFPGRHRLSQENPIVWDGPDMRFYEATTIAHGHLLHFKQVWRADGYSLGDLLYSLPLAPGQKKQIAVVDWERRDTAMRQEVLTESETLSNLLSRDRDISEIVSTSLREHVRGDSSAMTFGGSMGGGAAGGGMLDFMSFGGVAAHAIGGGYSSAGASQNGVREVSANAEQKIRDTTYQAASAIRNQRSTVIQTVSQGESVSVTTEVVANHNHCHAMTVEYFEVLRHFRVTVELADVRECLYVPLLIEPFDRRKALRWRDLLQKYLLKPALAPAFDAMHRIDTGYAHNEFPIGRFADERIEFMEGWLTIFIRVPTGGEEGFFSSIGSAISDWLFGKDPTKPRTATNLSCAIVSGLSRIPLNLQFTLVSEFAPNVPLRVRMRAAVPMPVVTRAQIDALHFTWTPSSDFPQDYQLMIRSGSMRYRTDHMHHHLFNEADINAGYADAEAYVDTPLDSQELRNPREEDASLESRALTHFNDHIEYYHKAIWWRMDPDRRFMLLDGFVAPNANGRSVASVVENRLLGFVGNSMIFPVGPGIQIDPTYGKDPRNPVDLINLYAPGRPFPSVRVSLPTKGVFAEAVMGACNSCEHKDDSRFWRWEESPIDEPTPILSPGAESRKSPPPDLTAKDFPTPMINIQNAPNEPDPVGLASALKVLGTPNLFPNLTGLEQTQKNAADALKTTMEAAKYFGGEASKLAQQSMMNQGGIDKSMKSIQQAQQDGMITKDQANDLSVKALKSLVGSKDDAIGTIQNAKGDKLISDQQAQDLTNSAIRGLIGSGMSTQDVAELTRTAGANDASVTLNRPDGEGVAIDAKATAGLRQPLLQQNGFFGLNTVVSEADLRLAIQLAAGLMRSDWYGGGPTHLVEGDNSQFGFLLSYWLASHGSIRPSTLLAAQTAVTGGTINFGQLLTSGLGASDVAAEAARVRMDLLVISPTALPANIDALLDESVRQAYSSREGNAAWSAAFVEACIRNVAINNSLESELSAQHLNRNVLLVGGPGHRHYVVPAYNRRFGPNPVFGTYHAFRITERTPQVGDIIIQDRQANTLAQVFRFDAIPALAGGRELHGDIVVEVGANDVVAMGGNLGNSVRLRRYPLDANGFLVAALNQLYTQEADNGTLPPLPAPGAGGALAGTSTARIFALLSPVEAIATIPGQPYGGGVIA